MRSATCGEAFVALPKTGGMMQHVWMYGEGCFLFENSRHLTDFQGTLEPARHFRLGRREMAAVYAPRVDNRGGALIVARGRLRRSLGRPPIAPTLEKRIREALATPGRPGVRVIAKRQRSGRVEKYSSIASRQAPEHGSVSVRGSRSSHLD